MARDAEGFDLEQAIDDLYASPREDFVTRRTALGKQARAAGDTAAAATMKQLTKPTAAAWLANQLARTRRDEVQALVALGDELRDATARLDGERLRVLSQQRTAAVAALAREAAAVSGSAPSATVARELEELLTTAITDPATGTLLLAGRLTSAPGGDDDLAWPTGVARPRPVPVDLATHPTPASRAERPDSRAAAAAQAELDSAREAVKHAEAERADREREAAAAHAQAQQAGERVAALARELHQAEQQQHTAREHAAAADRAAKQADRAASRAWQRVQAAEQAAAEGRPDPS